MQPQNPNAPAGRPGYVTMDPTAPQAAPQPYGYQAAAAPQGQPQVPVGQPFGGKPLPTLRDVAQQAQQPSADDADFEMRTALRAQLPPGVQLPGEPAAPAPTAAARPAKAGGKVKVFVLEEPLEVAGVVYTELTLRRPRWGVLESCFAHRLVTSGKLTHNSALIAACTGLPLEALQDLDGFEAMRLMGELADFFPQGLMGKLSMPTA